MPSNNLPEPGEFTRIFKRTHQTGQAGQDAEKKAADGSGIFPAEPPLESSAGHANVPPPVPPPSPRAPSQTPTAPGLSSGEPGEFTQYFMGGLPGKGPSGGDAPPRITPGVQRPNSPVPPPRNLASDNSGTFTERFAPRRDAPMPAPKVEEFGVHNPRIGPPPDLSKRSSFEESDPFAFQSPAKRDAPGEYTALFGSGSLPPTPKQSAVAPPPPAPIMNDSPNSLPGGGERTMRDIQVTAPTQQGPSEFTLHSGGRPSPPDSGGAAPETAANRAGGTRKMPVPNININAANPLAGIHGAGGSLPGASAHASASGANVTTPIGSASLHAPSIPPLNAAGGAALAAAGAAKAPKFSDQTKLILFFGALAILAVILVVVLVATQKS